MLRVIWFVSPALQGVADRRGFLADEALGVAGTSTASSDEQFEALRDGRQDAAVTAMDNVIMWRRRPGGEDLRIVGQIEATTALSLFARPGLDAVAALRGRRLLVDSAENGFVVALRALLADAGVDFGECDVMPAGGVKERFARLIEGEGDATLLGPPFVEMAMQAGMCRLADVEVAYPGFPGQGIVVRTGMPIDRRQELVRWLAALERARAECRRDPHGAQDDLVALGVPPGAAANLVAGIGDGLIAERPGVELLIGQRRRLGLPGGDDGYEDLVDPTLLASAGVFARQ